jgi:hypothetical protein
MHTPSSSFGSSFASPFASSFGQSHNAPNATDFVSTDAAQLASHMRRCASERGRFFGLHSVLEKAHGAVFPRLVTVGVAALVVAAMFSAM